MGRFMHIRLIRIYGLIVGCLCLSYGIYLKVSYSDPIREAVDAIEHTRLDQQSLEHAEKSLFPSEELITYNMGVRAYRANNFEKASEHFYSVILKSRDSSKKHLAYYNLGNILVHLELPQKAAEMYREALRLDPKDWESKYNLERLYVFYPTAFPDQKENASLDPEPGNRKSDKKALGQKGADKPDI